MTRTVDGSYAICERNVHGRLHQPPTGTTTSQPMIEATLEAIDEVVRRVHLAHPEASRIMWITLREEPIVYVNGAPYCLRRERFSLRNMKGS